MLTLSKKFKNVAAIPLLLVLMDMVLINIAFLLAFLIRYNFPFPEGNFNPYRKTFVFLTMIYIITLSSFGSYKNRFKSSWNLFRKIVQGLFLGMLFNIVFIYIFRTSFGGFPSGIFLLSFFISLLLIFKLNQTFLKKNKRIKKKVVVIGEYDVEEDIIWEKAIVERKRVDEIEELTAYIDTDEIVICEIIQNEKDLNLLVQLIQKLQVDVFFSPSIYRKLLNEKIYGKTSHYFLATFFGKKTDMQEFLIRAFDILGSFVILFFLAPVIVLVYIFIKLTSLSSVLYRQQRVGKNGEVFTLLKFRTMIKNAENNTGPVLASPKDPRVTKIGRILRNTRIDELPQLINVLRGQMSLVGPRPERPHFVKLHKVLREIRLTVKPGLTGLAQIRNAYDLSPKHKIKYDYLYIQRRSLLLNLYILTKTIPVILLKKGQ